MDFFTDPSFPSRPDHPDFWSMAEVILQLDGRMEDAQSEEDRERIFMAVVAEHVDSNSLIYMATQRAYRVLGTQTKADVLADIERLAMLSTVYVEAFIAGMVFQERAKS